MNAEPSLKTITCVHPNGLHRLGYWEWVPEGDWRSAPKIVCVHGLTRNGRDFDVVAPQLAAQGYHVVAPDMVGRGRSDRLVDPNLYAIPQYVSDCIALIARLDADKVNWLGTSMGGLIGMAIASVPGHPISNMLLNDVGPLVSAEGLARIKTYVGLDTRYSSFEEAEAALRITMAAFGPHTDEQFRYLSRHYIVNKGSEWGAHYDPAIAQPFHDSYTGEDILLWPLYDSIDIPVTVLRGSDSDLLPAEVAKEMTERGPKAKVIEFPGVGHAPTLITDDQVDAVKTVFGAPA